jgi:hypothetical protein
LVRDSLNEMIEEMIKDKHDKEGAILACCIALAVEEVEKWMYNGEFTPSVVPVKDGAGIIPPVIGDPEPVDLADLFPNSKNNNPAKPVAFPASWPNAATPSFPIHTPNPIWNSSPAQSGWKRPTGPNSIFDRLKAKAAQKPIVVKSDNPLDGYVPADWDKDTMRAFRDGNKAAFVCCVRALIPHFKVPISQASDYMNRMVKAHSHIWGVDVQK